MVHIFKKSMCAFTHTQCSCTSQACSCVKVCSCFNPWYIYARIRFCVCLLKCASMYFSNGVHLLVEAEASCWNRMLQVQYISWKHWGKSSLSSSPRLEFLEFEVDAMFLTTGLCLREFITDVWRGDISSFHSQKCLVRLLEWLMINLLGSLWPFCIPVSI